MPREAPARRSCLAGAGGGARWRRAPRAPAQEVHAAAEPQPLRRHRPDRHAERRGAARRADHRRATASSATPRGATSPSSSCRGCRRRCAIRRSTTGAGPDDPDYDLFDRSFDLQFQLLKDEAAGSRRWRSASATSSAPASIRASTWSPRKTVASDFTVTAGVGWGRLASVGGVENPFCSVSDELLRPRRRLRRGRQRRVRRASSTARRWASSAASSGAPRSTS